MSVCLAVGSRRRKALLIHETVQSLWPAAVGFIRLPGSGYAGFPAISSSKPTVKRILLRNIRPSSRGVETGCRDSWAFFRRFYVCGL